MGEIGADYEEMCRCLLSGLRAAQEILRETEKRCEKLFDDAVMAEIDSAERNGEDCHEVLRTAAAEKMKLWK